jgi:gluconolactonase
MLKLGNYSLSYGNAFETGRMDLPTFLAHSRELGCEGVSIHVRHLPGTTPAELSGLKRQLLDHGLSLSMLTVSTDFGASDERAEEAIAQALAASRTASYLGAPILRVFAGSPAAESDRARAFERAASAVRRLCGQSEVAVGIQNHNHGALLRTGNDVVAFFAAVAHPNLCLVLDTGQFAGCRGASGPVPAELVQADFLDSIRKTAALARHVRAKFYQPRADGSEPWIPYDQVFDILASVHYQGWVDVVYEPQSAESPPGEDPRRAIGRIATFLRAEMRASQGGEREAAAPPSRYLGLATERYVQDTEVRPGIDVAFLEGPAVAADGTAYFTNGPLDQILAWPGSGSQLRVVRSPCGHANGLLFDDHGRLLACESDGAVSRIDLASGERTVLASEYQGLPLGAPNDLCRDARGRIYFTSRHSRGADRADLKNGVYRIDADGGLARILESPGVDMPNGIDLSPDEKTLYLIDADGRQQGARRIRAYDLAPDGTVSNERTLFDFYPGRSGDGLAIDAEGNLWVAAGLHRRRGSSETLDTRPGIHVISPAGQLVAFVETPEDTITNCAFGGAERKTLYITCGKRLLTLRTSVAGKA